MYVNVVSMGNRFFEFFRVSTFPVNVQVDIFKQVTVGGKDYPFDVRIMRYQVVEALAHRMSFDFHGFKSIRKRPIYLMDMYVNSHSWFLSNFNPFFRITAAHPYGEHLGLQTKAN